MTEKAYEELLNAEVLISKKHGDGKDKIELVINGSGLGVAMTIGKALCDIANINKESNKIIYGICKSICDQFEETNVL